MDLHCKTCKHWHSKPADPMNLGVRSGECRGGPPSATMFSAPNGQLCNATAYPVMPETFDACAMYVEREASSGI